MYACPGYRLPTEAEWEYAYRAGTATAFYNGPSTSKLCGDCLQKDKNVDLIGWYCANSTKKAHPVAEKRPNAWGLYDMAGNEMEWCNDWYQHGLESKPVIDPWGATYSILGRVVRGGAYVHEARMLRAACRGGKFKGVAGYRCVRTIKP
jgi:formylglycine-generating enzyme required for sulfatase activity